MANGKIISYLEREEMYGKGRGPAWIATPLSRRQYYPMALGNGSDCVTIDYSGSIFSGTNGHRLKEQHQGLIPGWYKAAHRVYRIPARIGRAHWFPWRTGCTQPIIQAGYNIVVDGQIGDPQYYVQSFKARQAILTTEITMVDVRWRVITYLTDDHLWVERIEALRIPRDKKIDLVFFILGGTGPDALGTTLCRKSVLRVKPLAQEKALAFDYTLTPNDFHGQGFMWGTPGGKIGKEEITYANIKTGFAATHLLMAVDRAEMVPGRAGARACYKRLKACPEVLIRKAHVKVWTDYSRQSSVAVPDPASQGLYDLSLYWLRANQFPKTGSLNLGPFPCHWGGSCNAIPDAWMMQQALLASNHIEESRRLLEFYQLRMPRARLIAKALGCPGVRLCFFCSTDGQDAHADPELVRNEKIGANAWACYSFYDHWLISGRDDFLPESLIMMRELLDHALAVAVVEKKDRAYIGESYPSNEGACKVSNDSMISICMTHALRGYCEMAAAAGRPVPEHYARIAAKLKIGLRDNVCNGILAPFANAKFYGADAILCFLGNLPDGINRKSVLNSVRLCQTPWGGDSEMYSEKYRDWPWYHQWTSIIYSHWGWGRKAFIELQSAMKDCSALGAIPEKIRMDGYAIRYWYTTVHANYLLAFQTALCHDRPANALGLLQGMDGTWRDIEFNRLRMRGGLLVSLKVTKGRVRELVLRNAGIRPIHRKLIWNPRYAGTPIKDVSLRPGQTIKMG